MKQPSCGGCGKPVVVGDEDTCSGTDVVHEILLLEPDRFWHSACWAADYKARAHPKLSARDRAAVRWSA